MASHETTSRRLHDLLIIVAFLKRLYIYTLTNQCTPLVNQNLDTQEMSLLEVTHDAPAVNQYTSIEEHQAQTPGTFFGGKPVLHYHSLGALLSIERDALENNPAFSGLRSATVHTEGHVNGNSATEQIHIRNIDIWVTSE